MVMEASPSPQSVGREFVRQYYTLLNKAPAHLHRFYNNYSSFVHGGLDAPNRETLPVIGQKQIHNRIQQLNFRDCHAKISQVDSQATLGNGVVVQVTGELSNGGAPMRRFTQTFVLAAQSPKKYYVHNDIFRYQDLVFSDEESEGGCVEEEGGYPSAPQVSTVPQQVPPSPPSPHMINTASPAPHAALNGHDLTAHLVVTMQEHTIGDGESGAESPVPQEEEMIQPEPEPEVEPEPPVMQTAPAEPKTYANLLKSGGGNYQPPVTKQIPVATSQPMPPRPARASVTRTESSPPENVGSRRYSDSQQLFLGNLPPNATEDNLRALFGRFGTILELRILGKAGGTGGGRHNNYGFITYEDPQAATNCLNAGALFFPPDSTDGVKLNVEEKRARGVRSSGGGGASGGAGGGSGGPAAPGGDRLRSRRHYNTHRQPPPFRR